MELGVPWILLVLLSEGPAFGLELIDRARERSRASIVLNRGGTYLALRKLERQGSIRGWLRPSRGSGRPRRYYELTSRGIAEAESARAVLTALAGTSRGPVSPSEARRMAERVVTSGRLSTDILRFRDAARSADVR